MFGLFAVTAMLVSIPWKSAAGFSSSRLQVPAFSDQHMAFYKARGHLD